jgi:hypothetical protein
VSNKKGNNAVLPHFPVIDSRENLIKQTNGLDKEPIFVRLYLETLSSLSETNEKKTKLLYYLLENMNSNDNKISLDPLARAALLDAVGIKQSLYYKYMKQFTAYGYVTRCAKCIYMLNPHLFFRGYWGVQAKKARLEYIDLRLKYDENMTILKPVAKTRVIKKKKNLKTLVKPSNVANVEYYQTEEEAINAFKCTCLEYDPGFFILPDNVSIFNDWCEAFKLDTSKKPRVYPVPKITCNKYFKACISKFKKDKSERNYKTTAEQLTDYSWSNNQLAEVMTDY